MTLSNLTTQSRVEYSDYSMNLLFTTLLWPIGSTTFLNQIIFNFFSNLPSHKEIQKSPRIVNKLKKKKEEHLQYKTIILLLDQ